MYQTRLYIYIKRDLQKRPTKETYKRDLQKRPEGPPATIRHQKRPAKDVKGDLQQRPQKSFINIKRDLQKA